ncbi:signal transducing adaptor molecule, partial [Tremellales sp. Uapishka_1]
MFSGPANPYDEIVGKATDENLASEDWDLNIQVCDKVSDEGQTGARHAVGALQKRLAHRNPNVQIYALELANTLVQNCGKPLLEELSSRNWTSALDRLVNDRTTAAPVKKKALGFIKSWAKQFEDTGDANLGLMGELYDQLRAKNFVFDEPEPAPENVDEARRRQEEEDLARVLELSKQDKGGRFQGNSAYESPSARGSSSSQPAYVAAASAPRQTSQAYQPPPPAPALDPEVELDINSCTRVRALYAFTAAEVGELSFDRGDVIKVLDRGFKEWWRGACNGKIGIFPTTYVEAMPEPSPRELQEEAQEEARVFASLGLVDQLLKTLKSIDPSKGDRLDDRPEIEEMYQASVGLQGQINALIKKYSDQKAELEHMNANFIRAMRQYEELRSPPPMPMGVPQQHQPPMDNSQNYGNYGAPSDAYVPQYSQHPQSHHPQAPPQNLYPSEHTPFPQAIPSQHENAAALPYYSAQQNAPVGAPNYPPQEPSRQDSVEPGAAGLGAGGDPSAEHAAAWEAYYRQQAEQGYQPQAQEYGASPYPAVASAGSGPGAPGVEGVVGGMHRMSVNGQ